MLESGSKEIQESTTRNGLGPSIKASDEAQALLSLDRAPAKKVEPATLDLSQGDIYLAKDLPRTKGATSQLDQLPNDFGPDRRSHTKEKSNEPRRDEKFYNFGEKQEDKTRLTLLSPDLLGPTALDGRAQKNSNELEFRIAGDLSNDELSKLVKSQRSKEASDQVTISENQSQPGKFDSPEKTKLIADAEAKFKDQPEKLQAFKENMKQLEERAEKQKLSPEEIAKTYKQIDRLLAATGDKPLSEQRRKDLAEQVMSQAAKPTSIDQGGHNTCNVNVIEVRAYTKDPSAAAKLVADVALKGEYTSSDGRTLKVNPAPHGESRNNPPYENERSHASEIFQVTAGNIITDRLGRQQVPPQSWRYEQRQPGPDNNGEFVVNYSSNPPVAHPFQVPIGLKNAGMLGDALSAITGKVEPGTFLGRDTYVTDTSDNIASIRTEQELNNTLAEAKKAGKFPITVFIHSGNEPFWTDSGAGKAGGSGGGHVVNITDYNPGPPSTVAIDNSWGPKADHDARNPVKVGDLFNAMQEPIMSLPALRDKASKDKAEGRPDYFKEFDIIRLEKENGLTPVQLLEAKLSKAMEEAKKDWDRNPSAIERQKSIEKLKEVIDLMPEEARERLKVQRQRLGLN